MRNERPVVRLMTYNIRHGAGNEASLMAASDRKSLPIDPGLDLERTARVIQAEKPDIVALQEVDRFWARSGGEDQPAVLAALLGMNACYGANLFGHEDGVRYEYGTAILSRYPIVSFRNAPLPVTQGWEPRGLLEARIALPGAGDMIVLNTHLQVGRRGQAEEGRRQRCAQAQAIAARVAELDAPFALMGDLNASPDDPELAPLRRVDLCLVDAGREREADGAPTIPCHPEHEPTNRIDAILLSQGFTFVRASVPDNDLVRMASDHFPVVADVIPKVDG